MSDSIIAGIRPAIPARIALAIFGAAATLVAACSSYSSPTTTTGGSATALAVVSGSGQVGTTGSALAKPLVVKVTDLYGSPLSGIVVSFTATGGASLRSATATTNAAGMATDSVTQLGATAGVETVTASASGTTSTAIFTFTVQAALKSRSS